MYKSYLIKNRMTGEQARTEAKTFHEACGKLGFAPGFCAVMNYRELAEIIMSHCWKCRRQLPDPVYEQRENGRREEVTYCPCGEVYTV